MLCMSQRAQTFCSQDSTVIVKHFNEPHCCQFQGSADLQEARPKIGSHGHIQQQRGINHQLSCVVKLQADKPPVSSVIGGAVRI